MPTTAAVPLSLFEDALESNSSIARFETSRAGRIYLFSLGTFGNLRKREVYALGKVHSKAPRLYRGGLCG
jgi:hypothetical protein